MEKNMTALEKMRRMAHNSLLFFEKSERDPMEILDSCTRIA
jgi:hypothetical protein